MKRFLTNHGEALLFAFIITFTLSVVAPTLQKHDEAKRATQLASKDCHDNHY